MRNFYIRSKNINNYILSGYKIMIVTNRKQGQISNMLGKMYIAQCNLHSKLHRLEKCLSYLS